MRTEASAISVSFARRGEKNREAIYVESTEKAAELLSGTEGNIFLTTGSKELSKFTVIPDYQRGFCPGAVHPFRDQLPVRSWGSKEASHRYAGPFSTEINEAMLRQFQCSYLVTKDTGLAGGFPEKMEACQRCGVTPVIIGRPLQEGAVPAGSKGYFWQSCSALPCHRGFLL